MHSSIYFLFLSFYINKSVKISLDSDKTIDYSGAVVRFAETILINIFIVL